jgi:putative protease
VKFLQDVGFSQVVLARELSLAQIREISAATSVQLEFFIHGALCVSYSGQCNISHARTGRSANRGECAQLCRLPCSLQTPAGEVLVENSHLLSLKDMDQTDNLEALIAAGIRSFKIEGRLKGLDYVKNVTAWYRQKLDSILEPPRSGGRFRRSLQLHLYAGSQEEFQPGSTDYFLHGRQPGIDSPRSPKYVGEPLGRVTSVTRDGIEIDGRPLPSTTAMASASSSRGRAGGDAPQQGGEAEQAVTPVGTHARSQGRHRDLSQPRSGLQQAAEKERGSPHPGRYAAIGV